MKAEAMQGNSRWVIASLGGLGIIVVIVVLFSVPQSTFPLPTASVSTRPPAAVKMAKTDIPDAYLKAETELRDLRPLFLPTERNASLPEPRLEPAGTYLDQEYLSRNILDSTETAVGKDLRELPEVIMLNGLPLKDAKPRDALAPQPTSMSAQGFGRTADLVVAPMPARGGFVEVFALGDGRRVWGDSVPVEARPPTDKPWGPMEFLADVGLAGLASPLVVNEGSRVEEVDAHFRNYLTRRLRIGDRLEPGFYRVIVAP
jgi:hypothetical protein